jgi:hypothetical protein
LGGHWWRAWAPAAALGVIYLPGNLLISEQRYFYAAFPFLFVICVSGGLRLKGAGNPVQPGRWGVAVVAFAFLAPTLARPTTWRPPGSTAGECAWILGEKLKGLQLSGPVASSAQMPGGRAGMYVAFHLDAPWYGDAREAKAAEFEKSQATLVIVKRELPVCAELSRQARFVDLDGRLFGSPEEAARFPLKAYEVKRYDGILGRIIYGLRGGVGQRMSNPWWQDGGMVNKVESSWLRVEGLDLRLNLNHGWTEKSHNVNALNRYSEAAEAPAENSRFQPRGMAPGATA